MLTNQTARSLRATGALVVIPRRQGLLFLASRPPQWPLRCACLSVKAGYCRSYFNCTASFIFCLTILIRRFSARRTSNADRIDPTKPPFTSMVSS
jgi:hypothetical protein